MSDTQRTILEQCSAILAQPSEGLHAKYRSLGSLIESQPTRTLALEACARCYTLLMIEVEATSERFAHAAALHGIISRETSAQRNRVRELTSLASKLLVYLSPQTFP